MPKPWTAAIRGTHSLTYRFSNEIRGGWAAAIPWAISEFNRLADQHSLGVTLVEATGEDEGQVEIATVNGQVSFTFGGSTYSRTLAGSALQGLTVLVGYETGTEKAFMYLPVQPTLQPPRGVRRPVGEGILKMIALHELIHATGLENSDHNAADVFNGYPSPGPGRTSAQDCLNIMVGGRYRSMPPTIFTAETARKVQTMWA